MRFTLRHGAALATTAALVFALGGCGSAGSSSAAEAASQTSASAASSQAGSTATTDAGASLTKAEIEAALDLANISERSWSYANDAWTLAPVTAVTNPEIADEQGVSVCVPAAYVTGIDTTGDGQADVTAETYADAVSGSLVINYDAQVTSTNGQVYTAATAPVIVNTGAAGYSEQQNQSASATYAAEGYINVACGNRGKKSTATDADGGTYYTGDAPSCLVDQKNAVRFVKYNILLGNLPGSVDHFVSTGGSGGGAHASMLAATSNNPDFYDYEIDAGAVGVYATDDGYSTSVTIGGEEVELSDGMWGCIAYSAITPLAIGDTTMAFEYHLDPTYSFNTPFQAKLAELLSTEYMDYVNAQGLSVDEARLGLDIDGNGSATDTVALTIEHDEQAYPETNGYGGSYLDLYLALFRSNLDSYLANLAYGTDWTWFDAEGAALSDEAVAAMSDADRAQAFIEGRYAKGASASSKGGPGGGMGGPGGGMGGPGDGMGAPGDGMGGPGGDTSGGMGELGAGGPDGSGSGMDASSALGEPPTGAPTGESSSSGSAGATEMVGTPDAGTTQSATSGKDSANYASYDEMLAAYQADIAEVEAGDAHGKNIVELYNPLNYIGAEGTDDPTWTRVVMGAAEGDMSMLASLNMGVAWANAGTDTRIEWQWDGGHVPSEVLGDSFSLYVDEMFGEHVVGAIKVEKPAAEAQTANGDATEATGTDISSWVTYEDGKASFSLADIAAYRTAGAAKAIPGFDTIDYGQEDYVFGSTTADARHWDAYVLEALTEGSDELKDLFNAS